MPMSACLGKNFDGSISDKEKASAPLLHAEINDPLSLTECQLHSARVRERRKDGRRRAFRPCCSCLCYSIRYHRLAPVAPTLSFE